MSHEKTIGVNINGREFNIPSVVKGKQVSPKKAIESFFGKGAEGRLNRAIGRKNSPNRKNVTKSYGSVKEAEKAAKERSKTFDKDKKKNKIKTLRDH